MTPLNLRIWLVFFALQTMIVGTINAQPVPPSDEVVCYTCDPVDEFQDNTGDILENTADLWEAGGFSFDILRIST